MTPIERGVSPIGEKKAISPLFFKGTVIQGFGRGSKQLGIPTANLPVEEYESILNDIPIGVYYGWANVHGVNDNKIYKMAMSIGWNPFYKNTKKTIEIHLINKFEQDFYGHQLNAIAVGFIRPMCDFSSLDELIKAINDDIEYAQQQLDQQPQYQNHEFFKHCFNSGAQQQQEELDTSQHSHTVLNLTKP
ncbi:riboflavin kinase [Cavenderia fasciculata]|uniref:riboflavin kinase n=1 Tax=Cavenderia fasciculata TaxID=261658 RepID=F4QB89_CACFS|nr:riboflavin kinase [Cavenderia fasciculata]EGG14861.1 riboflavin kinase [Cavenderia fasciculata]|eukprot:XP_004351377.1 riboflavin kinase [Cavenderia fasciculata]